MRTRFCWLAHLVIVPCLFASACLAGPAYTDPEETDEDFAYQGEYRGTVDDDGEDMVAGVQVVALGDGSYRLVFCEGGLPGEADDVVVIKTDTLSRDGDTFANDDHPGEIIIRDDALTVSGSDGEDMGTLEKVHRESPTLGAEPPEGAVVLFDGSGVEAWQEGARMSDDGLLMQGCTSEETFQSQKVHLEFRLSYQPEDSGQGRGNSGCYLQGRYEVQILDSFGLEGLQNECGGIYSIAAPDVNMCLPPLAWQTYDIEFHAAQYDDEGNLTDQPRMTVMHNGVTIHDDVELPHATTAAPLAPGAEPGPLYLQDHGSPLRFRNVWIEPLEE